MGRRQAEDLAATLSGLGVEAAASSPYRRAVDTIAPFASAAGLGIELVEDLGERKLADPPIEPWRPALRRTYEDLDFAWPGGETSRACGARVEAALSTLCAAHKGRTVAAASHGNAVALFMSRIDPGLGFAFWQALRNPHIVQLVWRDGAFEIVDLG